MLGGRWAGHEEAASWVHTVGALQRNIRSLMLRGEPTWEVDWHAFWCRASADTEYGRAVAAIASVVAEEERDEAACFAALGPWLPWLSRYSRSPPTRSASADVILCRAWL